MLTYEDDPPWGNGHEVGHQSTRCHLGLQTLVTGKFFQRMSLSPAEIDTLSEVGRCRPLQKAIPRTCLLWSSGWKVGASVTLTPSNQLPVAYDVPASGVIGLPARDLPTGFTEDKMDPSRRSRPTARSVVHPHHCPTFATGPKWFRGEKPGVFFIAPQVKTKKNRIQLPSLSISWSVTPGNLLKSCGRAKPSSSKPVLT